MVQASLQLVSSLDSHWLHYCATTARKTNQSLDDRKQQATRKAETTCQRRQRLKIEAATLYFELACSCQEKSSASFEYVGLLLQNTIVLNEDVVAFGPRSYFCLLGGYSRSGCETSQIHLSNGACPTNIGTIQVLTVSHCIWA